MGQYTSAGGWDVLLLGFEEWENLGLRSIAAYLLQHGATVKIVPLPAPADSVLATIRSKDPGIVGFSLIFQRMLPDFADLIAYLRQHGVQAHFTMGGHFPSIEPAATLESIPGLDSVVRGEGEHTILELLHHLHQPDEWSQIQGLAFRGSHDGQIHLTPPRPKLLDLDSLPYPIRSDHLPTHRGLGLCSILGSRGCHYDCSFCSIHQFYAESPGPRRRTRSPANVAQEMERLFHERGVRIFIFEDDDLFMRGRVQREWIAGFVRELQQRGMADQILWRVSCRVDDVDPEPISRMMEAGLMSIYIGIESGNDRGLRVFNKHYTVEDIHRALAKLRQVGIPFEYGFMILNPDTTFATLRDDIAFLKEISADGEAVVQFTKMVPYAGTSINRQLRQSGRLKGTLAAPDYGYLDPRLELFQVFLSQAFHFRNFDGKGLAERLRFAKLDVAVVRKFCSEQYEGGSYATALGELIRRSNEEALEKMSMAARFMEKRTEAQIIDKWPYIDLLVHEEKAAERQLTTELDWLMVLFGFEAEVPRIAPVVA
jgi:anaerobic magnesium-protoporphyrin IX monomethyl ester cyclase